MIYFKTTGQHLTHSLVESHCLIVHGNSFTKNGTIFSCLLHVIFEELFLAEIWMSKAFNVIIVTIKRQFSIV